MSGTNQQAFDNRLVSVQIEINGQLQTFDQTFWIKAKGQKFANANQNECTVEIANLDANTRNNLLTETSPFLVPAVPKLLNLYAGRVSTGLFLVYSGDVMTAKIKQPPDIILSLKCGTGHYKKGSVGRRSGGKVSKLSTLAAGVASNLGLSLRMEAPDTNISNYAHSGNALAEIDNMGAVGNCQAYADDQHLVLKTANLPLSGDVLNLSEETGMIGIPELNEKGLKVKFLYTSVAKLGGAINITSKLNPAANGLFVIFKLGFDLASREKEFYCDAECVKAKQ